MYYKNKLEQKDKIVSVEIQKIYQDDDDTLGHKKIGPMLGIGKNRAKRIMKKYDIEPRQRKGKYYYRGKSNQVFDNLANDPEIKRSNSTIIFSDIFEFKLKDGSAVRGCFSLHKQSRQILSMAFDYWMKSNLVTTTIDRIDYVDKDIFWHTDQGKQYGSKETIEKILIKGFTASMSRAGTPTDNGFAERFVGVFKHAVVRKKRFESIGEFLKVAEKWVNFYNFRRPHESLGQIPPAEYAKLNNMQVVSYLSNLFV